MEIAKDIVNSRAYSICFMKPNSNIKSWSIYSGCENGSIVNIQSTTILKDDKENTKMKAHESAVTCISTSNDGLNLLSCGKDGYVRIHNRELVESFQVKVNNNNALNTCYFIPGNENKILVASKQLDIIDIEQPEVKLNIPLKTNWKSFSY